MDPMTPETAVDLAGDLLRELAPLHGNADAVDTVCRRWLKMLGPRQFGIVCAATVRLTLVHCLHEVPRPQVPPGAVEFSAPAQEATR